MQHDDLFVCVTVFVPVSIFQSCYVLKFPRFSKQRIKWLAQRHNAVLSARFEPATSRSQIKHSTTALLISHDKAHLIS